MRVRPSRQHLSALLAIAVVVLASLLTGQAWPVAVDSGGETAGNPISHYGPHWLYPSLATVILAGLLVTLLRTPARSATLVGLTAFAAGAASNLAQWVVLGGVSNPVPSIHGGGHMSIGDICLWLGILAILAPLLLRRRPASEPTQP